MRLLILIVLMRLQFNRVTGLFTKLDKMKETEKQLEYIRFIEEETGIIYKGQTKQEASKYISENKDKVPASALINMWALVKGY